MKKTILLFAAISLISVSMLAQKLNDVKIDLFSPILRTFAIKYERAVTENVGIQLGFFYTGYHPRDSESTLNGWGITPEFRFYLSETPAPNGTYLAPNLRYMSLEANDPVVNQDGTLTNLSLAINLGKQVLLKDIILIDAWVGPSYNFRSVSSTAPDFDPGISSANGFGLRIGLAIGIAF